MKKRIRNRLSEGFSLTAISEEFNISTDSIILNLLSDGLSPSQIAKQCGISTGSLIQQIHSAVGTGCVRRSEVQASLNKDWLLTIDRMAQTPGKITPEMIQGSLKAFDDDCNLDVEEVRFYLLYIGSSLRAVDMYEMLLEIELSLHTKIREILIAKYGSSDTGWWTKGIPKSVRFTCHKVREDNNESPKELPYGYTTLIDLKDIVEKQWGLFNDLLPSYAAKEKEHFTMEFGRLNSIRNKVMHPVRGSPPNEEEFEFVKQMHLKLAVAKWRRKNV